MACRFSELVVNSRDPEALAAFWAAVLDYRVLGRDEDGSVEIGPAEGFGGAAPTLVFGPVADPTEGPRRLHIDVNPTDRDQDAELQRLLDLGAVRADVGQTGEENWHVLADPEGNEFCLLQRRLDPLSLQDQVTCRAESGPGGVRCSQAADRRAPRRVGRTERVARRCSRGDDGPVILIVVKFPVRPERADEWVALAADYARSVNAEEGSLFFEWSRSLEDPETFVCVEGFRDAEAGAAHVGTDAFTRFVEQAPELVAAQPQIIYVDAPDVPGWGPMGEIQPR